MYEVDPISAEDLEGFYDWMMDREYENITWEEFLDEPKLYIDMYFDSYISYFESSDEDEE